MKKKKVKVTKITKHRNLVELFLKTLSALYPDDNLMPGVTVSWLPPGHSADPAGRFYASVRRFDNPLKAQRITQFEAESLDAVFLGLVNLWAGKSADVIAFQTAMSKRKGGKHADQVTAHPSRRRR